MLFSSYEFLLIFLPLTLAGFVLARRWSRAAAQSWLLAASIFFYGWWNPGYLGLLTGSIVVNYAIGCALMKAMRGTARSRLLLAIGIVFNLGLLGYYKYAGFLTGIAAQVAGTSWSLGEIVLPLAISFFTFQQVAFLIDAAAGRAPAGGLREYALFVLFFPQLIAGPIVHHGEMLTQFADERRLRLTWAGAASGLALFLIGLFKKVALADSLAPTADAVFDAAAGGASLIAADAWIGTLAYTLQLYFDFSGYSDMAIGLGRLFGIELPQNFDSPYQATNIADFWRRWHMTLSRFLRDYLYIPLGGSRCAPWRVHLNLLLTMLLGGIWHGAGWTFVLWGALHGLLLMGGRIWSGLGDRLAWAWRESVAWHGVARCLTLLAVMAGWVLFRAESLSAAGRVYAGLCGAAAATESCLTVDAGFVLQLIALLLAASLLPNSREFTAPESRATLPRWCRWLAFRESILHGAALAAVLLVCLSLLTRVQEFLYFQF